MKNHTMAYTANDLLIKYVYIILLFQCKNGNPYTVGVDALIDPINTKTWEYNDSTWSDLLTNYNGTPITYDEIGNPLTIGSKSLTWTGRQLQSITDDENNISYTYNGDGLRTSKTVNGTKTEYYYNGSILAGQKSGDDTLVFMYDNNSDIFGFIYNNTEYYYIKNAQNDVVAIADADGKVLIKYFYDAWGKITSITKASGSDITDLKDDEALYEGNIITGENKPVLDENGNPVTSASTEVTLARINPILYRSYYYDKETEWYYLTSRFYSPELCRFINSDDSDIIDGGNDHILENNLFTYCFNNPINLTDDDGTWPSWATKVAIGAAVIAAAAIVTIATGGAGAGVAGFIAAGVLKGAAIGGAIGAATGAAGGAISHRVSTGSWQGAGNAALEGGASGFMSGAITGAITGAASSTMKVTQAAKAWDASSKGGPLKNMSDHYYRHVIKEGKRFKTKNIITYTKDAKKLWWNSKGVGKLMSSGSLRLKGAGVGGFYSPSGLIRSFFYQ